MKILATVLTLLMLGTATANAQKRQEEPQSGERPLRIGSWSGTVELDAFTLKERIIVSSERNGAGLVLRCMGEKLSIGWINLTLFRGPFTTGDEAELSLRIGDDVIGPFRLTALSDRFMAADLSHAELSDVSAAKSEIGFRFSYQNVTTTGGLRAQRTPDLAARLKKSCPDVPPKRTQSPTPSTPKSNGVSVQPLGITPRIETNDPDLVSKEAAHKAYVALKSMCPEAGSWSFVQRLDITAGPDTSDDAKKRGVRSSVTVVASTSMDEQVFELLGGTQPIVSAEVSAWRFLCGDKAPEPDSDGNVAAPALAFLP